MRTPMLWSEAILASWEHHSASRDARPPSPPPHALAERHMYDSYTELLLPLHPIKVCSINTQMLLAVFVQEN